VWYIYALCSSHPAQCLSTNIISLKASAGPDTIIQPIRTSDRRLDRRWSGLPGLSSLRTGTIPCTNTTSWSPAGGGTSTLPIEHRYGWVMTELRFTRPRFAEFFWRPRSPSACILMGHYAYGFSLASTIRPSQLKSPTDSARMRRRGRRLFIVTIDVAMCWSLGASRSTACISRRRRGAEERRGDCGGR